MIPLLAGEDYKEYPVQKTEICQHFLKRYSGLVAIDAWGEQSFFYNPQGSLPRGVYFATLKNKDGDNDKASQLDRAGVFRLSFGMTKKTYQRVVGEIPARPVAGGVVDTHHDFTCLSTLLPHPVYGWMAWVCVLNPDATMLAQLSPLLDESYELVLSKYTKRIKSRLVK